LIGISKNNKSNYCLLFFTLIITGKIIAIEINIDADAITKKIMKIILLNSDLSYD